MYPELAEEYGAIHVESFLGALTEAAELDRNAAMARYMQPDGLHPSAEGIALIVEALGPRVEELIERVSPQS
jgi:acyl-CoA thioesterase-1